MVVGHRQMFHSSQTFGIDGDHGWNHTGQPYIPTARRASGSSSSIHPVDNMTIQGGHLPSRWNPAPRSSGYSSPILNDQLPHYQSVPPCPSQNPYVHQYAPGNHVLQDNYLAHPSSFNIGGQRIDGVDGGFYDQTIGNSRGQLKRKSPSVPPMWDSGPTNRYYDVGSSSDTCLPANPLQEQQNAAHYHANSEYPPSYRVNSHSIGCQDMVRNVRSRTGVCPPTNMVMTHLPSTSLHNLYSSCSSVRSNSLDFWGYGINAPREGNSNFISPAAPGVTVGSNSRSFNHNPNSLNPPISRLNNSLEVGGYNNGVASNANHVPQNVSSHLIQSVGGIRGGYRERSNTTFRASSSNFPPGHVASSNRGQQIPGESYSSRHQHDFSNLRLHNVDRNGRNSMLGGRYASYNGEASSHDRFTPEGLTGFNYSAFDGSRSLLDQHNDMRLDIDDMSYEELLTLGEQIGTVSTGLSDGLISKCLTESIYCSSGAFWDKGTCVICLEEYEKKDEVRMLKACGHDFHVACIWKWLSMKNSCPICKASAMDNNMNM